MAFVAHKATDTQKAHKKHAKHKTLLKMKRIKDGIKRTRHAKR